MSLNATALKQAGAQFPKAAGVSRFVSLLVSGIPVGPGPSVPTYDPVNGILTVNQINLGQRARFRAVSDGLVLEILGTDNNWHIQLQWHPTKPTGV